MMTLELNQPVVDLDGLPVQENMTLGKALAAQMAYSSKGNSVKLLDWALNLHRGTPIQLDDADHTMLVKFVEDSDLRAFVKAPIIKRLTQAKEKVS